MNKIVQYNLSIDLAEVTKAAIGAPEFLALPSSVKAKFYDAREIFRKMAESVKSGKSLRSAAREASEKFGITPSKARRLFKEVQDSNGHWTSFIDTRHSSVLWRKKKEQTKLPKAFLDYWRGLCMENQRCNRQAWMKLLRAWERWRTGAGEPIPGYDTPPTSYGSGNYPEGWSYNNLLRHAPTSFELAAVRQSRGAAMSKLPCVRTTREDLHFFGEIQFDDMWHDFMIAGFGNKPGAVRLLEFGCIDVHSGFMLPPLLKPRLIDTSAGTMKNLNTADFRFFLASVFTQYGYNPKGTVLTVEHGTAAISKELEGFLSDISGGAITVNRGGISGQGAFIGAYEERGKGNPRAKSSKEGIGKLIHNALATLPGQVGTGIEARPASLHGRLKEYSALMKAVEGMDGNALAALKIGILPLDLASEIVFEHYRILNGRTQHDIQGFEKLGYVRLEIRLPGSSEWVGIEDAAAGMSAEQARAFSILAAGNKDITRTRKLSPQEVFNMHKAELVRLPEWAIPQIVGMEYGKRRKPRRMVFEFEDREIEPNALLRYEAKAIDIEGREIQLKDGEEYLTYVNPFNHSRMFVTKIDGGYIGVCRRWEIPSRADRDSVMRDYGRIRGMYNEQIQRVNRLHGERQLGERENRMKLNTEVLSAITQADFIEGERPRLSVGKDADAEAYEGTEGFTLDDFQMD